MSMSYDRWKTRSPDDDLYRGSAWKPRRVNVDYWEKPYPFRDHDWQATYDGDEPDADGNMAVGYGATRVAALADLLRNYPRDELIGELRERKPRPETTKQSHQPEKGN